MILGILYLKLLFVMATTNLPYTYCQFESNYFSANFVTKLSLNQRLMTR